MNNAPAPTSPGRPTEPFARDFPLYRERTRPPCHLRSLYRPESGRTPAHRPSSGSETVLTSFKSSVVTTRKVDRRWYSRSAGSDRRTRVDFFWAVPLYTVHTERVKGYKTCKADSQSQTRTQPSRPTIRSTKSFGNKGTPQRPHTLPGGSLSCPWSITRTFIRPVQKLPDLCARVQANGPCACRKHCNANDKAAGKIYKRSRP